MFRLANAPKFNFAKLGTATTTHTFGSRIGLSTNAFNPDDPGVPQFVTEQQTSTGAPVFGGLTCGSSFADLARSNEFIGLSTRATIRNLMRPQNPSAVNGTINDNNTNAHDAASNQNAANDHADNLHYDPIIDLPDEIQVNTGEENEITTVCDRAKLYRFDFDNKEVKRTRNETFSVNLFISIILNHKAC